MEQVIEELERLREAIGSVQEKLNRMTERYARPIFYTEHPHIVRVEGVQGGDPIVLHANRTVRGIVELSRQMSFEELLREYEGSLTPAQLFDALSYYYDHPGEIDQYIAENRAAQERWEHPAHAYVMKHSGINNGEPSLRNSKVTVREIVERTRVGESVEDLLKAHRFLNRAQIYDALSYYHDHTDEIENYMRANEEPAWQMMHPAST